MENYNYQRKSDEPKVDIKQDVLGKIKNEQVQMRSRLAFMLEKFGAEGFLALMVLVGALAVAVIFYILKKIGTLDFLKLGSSGWKAVFLVFPYDYLVLFLFSIIPGCFIAKKLNSSMRVKGCFRAPTFILLAVTIVLGFFLAFVGGESFWKTYLGNRSTPHDITSVGKIISADKNEILIQEEDGDVEKLILANGNIFPYVPEFSQGKTIRAVGKRDPQNREIFHAEAIGCCD